MKDKRKNPSQARRREPRLQWTGGTVVARVEKMVPGGQAMARHDGQVVFVPGALPGEEVEIELSAAKGGYRLARLVSIREPSPDRVPPACPHYGRCGGCDLQHAAPEAQLRFKVSMVQDALRRQGGYGLDGVLPAIRVIGGPVWEYRNRMRFHPLADGGSGRYGLKRRGSELIEAIADCPVAAPEIRAWLGDQSPIPVSGGAGASGLGDMGRLEPAVFSGGDMGEESAWGPAGVPVFGCGGSLSVGDGECSVEVGGRTIRFGLRGFFQSNVTQLRSLAGLLTEWTGRIGPIGDAADLYCGCGVFAALLPESCASIDAVDTDPVNCRFALLNTDPGRTTVHSDGVDAWLAARDGGFPELVVVDPPRAGLTRPLLGRLAADGPRHLFFVSCDPVTFSRDLKELRGAGYRVNDLVVLDFYPQTSHIETACWLERP